LKKIYKYPLATTDTQTLGLPEGAKILSVISQSHRPVVYALVDDTEKVSENIVFTIVGTGNPAEHICKESMVFLGTVVTHTGLFVWHVFYERL
jgi:hypothetical protein